MKHIFSVIALGLSSVIAQQTEPLPVQEVAIYPNQTITVDGNLNEPAWKNAAKISAFKARDNGKLSNQTEVFLFSDNRYLNIAYICYDKEMDKLQRTVKEHDGPFWNHDSVENDSVEIFFDPWGKRMNVIHFAATALGTRYDAMGNDTHGWNPAWEAAVRDEKDRWILEARIPLKEIFPKGYVAGDELLANFCRTSAHAKELSCWSNAFGGWKAGNGMGTLIFGSLRNALSQRLNTLKDDLARQAEKASSSLKQHLEGALQQAEAIVLPKEVNATVWQQKLAEINSLRGVLEESVREEALQQYRESGYAVLEKSEWKLFPPKVDYATLPEAGETKISALLLKGQSEYRTLLVANLTNETLDLMVKNSLPQTSVNIFFPAFLRTKDGRLGADALIPPDNLNRLTIPPGEQREIWVEINGVAVGEVQGELKLIPTTASMTDIIIPVHIRTKDHDVSPYLPDAYGWSFLKDAEDLGLADAYHKTLMENHCGYVMISGLRSLPRPKADDEGNFLEPLDWEPLHEILEHWREDVLKGRTMFFIQLDIWEKSVLRHIFNKKEDSSGWKIAFRHWIEQLVSEIKKAGFGYEHFLINPADEIADERYIRLTKLIREADPQVRLISNATRSVEEMERNELQKYSDIFMPHRSQLVSEEGQRRVAWMLATGKPVGFYFYSEGANEKIRDPFQNFNWWFWYAHAIGLRKGPFGYWSFTQFYGDVWNRYKSPKAIFDIALIYPGNGIAIETRRLKAWKRSMEDIALLEAVEAAIHAESDPDKRKAMENIYRNALASVVGFEPDAFEMPLKEGTLRQITLTRSLNQIDPDALREARESLIKILP